MKSAFNRMRSFSLPKPLESCHSERRCCARNPYAQQKSMALSFRGAWARACFLQRATGSPRSTLLASWGGNSDEESAPLPLSVSHDEAFFCSFVSFVVALVLSFKSEHHA